MSTVISSNDKSSLKTTTVEGKDEILQETPRQFVVSEVGLVTCTLVSTVSKEECVKRGDESVCYQSDWHCWGAS